MLCILTVCYLVGWRHIWCRHYFRNHELALHPRGQVVEQAADITSVASG